MVPAVLPSVDNLMGATREAVLVRDLAMRECGVDISVFDRIERTGNFDMRRPVRLPRKRVVLWLREAGLGSKTIATVLGMNYHAVAGAVRIGRRRTEELLSGGAANGKRARELVGVVGIDGVGGVER